MSAARSHRAVAAADWPATDRAAWNRAIEAGDLISGPGIAAGWAQVSRDNACRAYGRYIGFLERSGRLRRVDRIGQRLVEEDLCAFGRELAPSLASYSVLGIFASLGMAFRAMDPGADRLVLKTIVSRLARTVRSVRDIAGNLIRPRDLIAIGVAMMDEAERSTEPSWRSARLYCDGLLIMFMALCPLRPGAVSEMRIGTHLIIDGSGVAVCFPPVEGRKRRLEDVPLTEELARRILRYLGHFRAMLCVGGTQHPDAVWLTAYGNPLDMISLSKRVRYALKKRTRKNFSAHMFRHSAATFIADYAPQMARMIIGLLGHSGFRTAQDYYIKGQMHAATRKYQEFVADLTRRTRPKSRRGQARYRRHDK